MPLTLSTLASACTEKQNSCNGLHLELCCVGAQGAFDTYKNP